MVLRREKETPLMLGVTTAVIMAWSVLCGLMAYFSWREEGQVNIQWAVFCVVSAVVVKISFDRFKRLRKSWQQKSGAPE